jgi:hypothetical protein
LTINKSGQFLHSQCFLRVATIGSSRAWRTPFADGTWKNEPELVFVKALTTEDAESNLLISTYGLYKFRKIEFTSPCRGCIGNDRISRWATVLRKNLKSK